MSGVISFRTDDEVVDTVDRIVEQADEDVSRALVTKRLVEEAVDARERPLWVRVGMSDHDATQVEKLRREAETREDLARRLFLEALEARDEDVLDAIGASDELREAVEEHREEGESLDGAVERLLRVGVDGERPEPGLTERMGIGVAVAVLGLLFVVAYVTYGPLGPIAAAVGGIVFFPTYPYLHDLVGRAVAVARA